MANKDALESIPIGFVCGAMPDDPVEAHGLWGRERISRLFEFDILLARPKPYTDDELDTLLKSPCALAMGTNNGDVVHGILERVRALDASRSVAARYIARLVPTVWLLTLSRTSRIYQNMSVPDMVRSILSSYGLKEDEHFEVRVNIDKKSPVREYIAQYQESDWDFIQRWLEQEGFFYWFKHTKTGEVLVIADDNADATPIASPTVISYRERNNLSTGGVATVWDFCLEQRRIPARVAVFDYNYRTPTVPMVARAEVDPARGFGSVFYYGEHFKDQDTGAAIAKLRSEQLLAQRRIYTGRTDCSRFRVGHTYELENHHDAANDGEYLITSIEHRAGFPLLPDRDDLGDAPQRYFARFESIPLEVAYRPAQTTPWPRVHGIMHAHIDGDTSGDYAELDAQGRYRVRMPFDVSGSKGQKASRWIRMAQPYSGPGYGSHHPLHKGTEVLIAHIDGDPDRPIIVGSVPNPHTPSPSTSANATQSVIQTASGIRIEMEDLQT
jgi:type VI secretion system secreted protein VgrG